jgi:hypothetical protein
MLTHMKELTKDSFLEHKRTLKLDKICVSKNWFEAWDLCVQKHDGLSFVCVQKKKTIATINFK